MPEIRRGDVYVSTGKLRDLAKDFDKWADDIDRIIPGLTSMKFTPGSVPNAFALRQRFENVVAQGYVTSVSNLRRSFLDIADELMLVAKGYEDAEDSVTDDVERLADLLAAAKKPFTREVPKPQVEKNDSPPSNG